MAPEAGAAGPTLNLLFRHALEVGKRARTETAIARSVTSVSQAAVVMATEQLGTLEGARAMVLGAGEMGRGMLTILADAGLDEITLVNRTLERAQELAHPVGARAAHVGSLIEELAAADVVFTSTAAAEPLITVDAVRAVMAARDGRDLVIVDIAMPRDVEPAVAHIDGVTLLDLEGLSEFAERGLADRRREVPAVQAIVESELDRYEAARTSREVAPLVSDLHHRAEDIRLAELERFATRLVDLDPAQRDAVEALTRGLIAKLVHTPTIAVKDASGTPRGERLAAALRDLFDL